jgi:hypothetical protein
MRCKDGNRNKNGAGRGRMPESRPDYGS